MLRKFFGFSSELSNFKLKAIDFRCANTQALEIVKLPIPKQIRIHMDQHEKYPCVPIVKKGDEVKVGQVIAEHNIFPALAIHASVSGKVTKIQDALLGNDIKTKEIVIEADGIQDVDPEIKPPLIHHDQDFIDKLENSGILELNNIIISLQGTGARAHSIDTLLINATTWEPFVSAPIREILENPDDVLIGMITFMKHLNIENGIIGIENSQSEGVACLKKILNAKKQKYATISLKELTSSYTKGSNQLLIQACNLPEKSTLVLTGTTVIALSRYLRNGVPVKDVRITVNGSAINEAKNVLVPIGTPIKDVIEFCGGYKETPKKILQGGPLLGIAVLNDDATISKQTTAVFAFDEEEALAQEETDCIRCGRCIDVCPVNLMPVSIDKSVRYNQLDSLKSLNATACAQCGSCSFICPANRHLVQTINLGKILLENNPISKLKEGS